MFFRTVNLVRRIILLGALALPCNGSRAHAQSMFVSVPVLHIQKNERIVGFDLHVHSGRVAQLPNVPIGWNISVDNDPSWNTSVTGSIVVGSAALSAHFFRHFVVVEKEKSAPSDNPFALEGEIVVTSDFLAERTIGLSMRDFLIEVRNSPLIAKSHVPGD